MVCCPERNTRIPAEFRLAIGASNTRAEFDGSGILNLCLRDPGVHEDNCGNAISIIVRHIPDLSGLWAPRQGASEVTPLELFRTGFGVRPAWDIEITVGTSRLGFVPPNAAIRPEVNDGSLWHLVSLMGLSASDVDFEPPAPFPPHLFLTTNYQHDLEQWIPVGIDPDNSTFDPPAFLDDSQLTIQTMRLRLVAREMYLKVIPAWFPSQKVADLPNVRVTTLPATISALGGFQTSAAFDVPLPASTNQGEPLGLMDGLLLNVGNGTYSWHLFTITGLASDRTSATLLSRRPLADSFVIPPADPIGIRTVIRDVQKYLPTYKITPFPGGQIAPARGPQLPLPGAFLLGDPYDV